MHQILAIIRKDILQWTRRPLYFISSTLLGVLIMLAVGNTLAGSNDIPFGLYDPDSVSDLAGHLADSKHFHVTKYDDISKAKHDLAKGRIVALASVSQDPLDDNVTVWTEGHNPMVDQQMSMGLFGVLTQKAKELTIPLHSAALFPATITLRDYITPGLAAYLCYVIASMNIGFAWIYEWMEKTYKQISLAPNGLRAAIVAKTVTVMLEASVVLWLAMSITSPIAGFTLGNNFVGLVLITMLSMFCFTCIGLGVACFLRTIRIYTMVISICGVALMFASGIVIPVEAMPRWEQITAMSMPMYYSADAFKGVMLGTPAYYVRDVIVLVAWALGGLSVATVFLTRRNAVI
jgi:ABC-type polysaccharide/polyol phosphate export permease